ncbi:hypothetical protein [Robbsia sp. KACC 23696]|uniref:hypothetical protein n=1 Tax=Robbsia sp. KACC 23696 TaxID=3149231 RepID=UPI00325ABAA5
MTEKSDAAIGLIAEYRRRRGLPDVPLRDRTATVLVFDRRYRIELSPSRQGGVLIRGRLMILPFPGPQRDAAVLRLGRIALWSASRSPLSCAVDTAARAAWLEWHVEALAANAATGGLALTTLSESRSGATPGRPAITDAEVDALAHALGRFVDMFARWRDILARPESVAAERVAHGAFPFLLPNV